MDHLRNSHSINLVKGGTKTTYPGISYKLSPLVIQFLQIDCNIKKEVYFAFRLDQKSNEKDVVKESPDKKGISFECY